jgi:hypothetical protein
VVVPPQPQVQAQSQPQPRSYSQPRNEARQNYSAPAVVAAPQPVMRNSAPAPVQSQPQQSSQQSQFGGGRYGNQGWAMH